MTCRLKAKVVFANAPTVLGDISFCGRSKSAGKLEPISGSVTAGKYGRPGCTKCPRVVAVVLLLIPGTGKYLAFKRRILIKARNGGLVQECTQRTGP